VADELGSSHEYPVGRDLHVLGGVRSHRAF
jgi:hypothetical protein